MEDRGVEEGREERRDGGRVKKSRWWTRQKEGRSWKLGKGRDEEDQEKEGEEEEKGERKGD